MTGQLTTPPAYMWNRIEKILDEQDNARKHTEKLLSDTFRRATNARRVNFLLAFVAGISLLTFIARHYSAGLKQS